ncbi:MAG: response regulator [Desulfuromonadales bacterium]|nr:response regulator [Desulfuromonadales bacterium]
MGNRILIIDDDPNICRFLSEALKLRGYLVKSFAAGEEGLLELKTGDYQLALLDILLPGRSGLEICRELRLHPATRQLPIMMMTAFYREAAQIREARESYGVTDYLLKPFTLPALYQKVEALVGPAGRRRSRSQLRVEGSLVETPIPKLLHNHYVLRATGLLHLEYGTLKKVVYLRDGYPIFARSNLVRECLGQMLIREGRLSTEECEESLRRATASGRLQGTVLIELGLLTPHELTAALGRQVTEKLLEVFAWPEGTYRFFQGSNFKKHITAIDLSPATLILEGLRRHYPPRRISEILLPHRSHFPRPAENPLYRYQDLPLSPADRRLVAQCHGNLSVAQILEHHPLSRQENERLLAALLLVGMMEIHPQPIVDPQEPLQLEAAEKDQLRESFLAEYRELMPKDHFALLGVSPQAPVAEVRKAFFALVKKFHPDRFRREYLSPELQRQINALFQKINEAHETLSDPSRRRLYQEQLRGGAKVGPDVATVLQAETAYQKGLVLLRVRNYRGACQELAGAVKLSPEEPEYLTHYAWALYKAYGEEPPQRRQAQELLVRSATLNPRLWTTHLYLGQLHKADGQLAEAEKAFERTIQCNPDCTEALRELRLSNLRRDRGAKGVLGRWLSR